MNYKVTTINNTIYFIGEIDIESTNDLIQELHKLEDSKCNNVDKNIKLYITSDGGSASEGLRIHDILNTTNLNITIYISGFVGSAATLFAFTKHKVIMYKHSVLAFHELSNSHNHKYSNAKASLYYADILMNNLLNIYNTKMNIELDWLVTDKYLTSKECLELGIVDEVIN